MYILRSLFPSLSCLFLERCRGIMAEGFCRPDPLIFDVNKAENWRKFELELDIFIAAAHSEKPDKTKAYILLNLARPEAIEREWSFTYAPAILAANGEDIATPAESREDPEGLKRKFREVCNLETDVTMERHTFNTKNQNPGETVEAYVRPLWNKVKPCNFDRLVCGITNDSVRRVSLRESDLTLVKAVKICQISELTEQNTKVLTSADAVHYGKGGRKAIEQRQHPVNTKVGQRTSHCGGNHPAKRDQCKSFGVIIVSSLTISRPIADLHQKTISNPSIRLLT